jgi:hypothetical protein
MIAQEREPIDQTFAERFIRGIRVPALKLRRFAFTSATEF